MVADVRRRATRTPWQGPTARFLEHVYGCKSPASLYIRHAQRLAREANIPGPPYDPRQYAAWLGMTVAERGGMTLDGILERTGSQYAIYVNADMPEYRKNFTIAHEIAHSFFFDAVADAQRHRGAGAYDLEEERLCNLAAAELLMPIWSFKRDAGALKDADGVIPPPALFSLIDTYRVSLTAIARRVSWVFPHLACATWKRDETAINLDWITPSTLKPLILAQNGKTAIERALTSNGNLASGEDTYYGPSRARYRKKTAAVSVRSGSVWSVILWGPAARPQNGGSPSTINDRRLLSEPLVDTRNSQTESSHSD